MEILVFFVWGLVVVKCMKWGGEPDYPVSNLGRILR